MLTIAENDDLTFEVILHDNGDIVMQYKNLVDYTGTLIYATTGIECPDGLDGLQYLFDAPGLSDNKAVRYFRPPVRIEAATLSPATVGLSYSASLTATAGIDPYTWAIDSGSLPEGLHLNSSTGEISGTPVAAGAYDLTVEVTDARSVTSTQALSVDVYAPLAITTNPLPAGTPGTTYSATLTRSGGLGPYHWSVASGSLPSGLSLDGSTGVISGTPTAIGTANFVVQVEDSISNSATLLLTEYLDLYKKTS